MREPTAHDRDPVTVQRLLALRQFPGFEHAELAELAIVAENVVEKSFAVGELVALPSGRPPALQLVLEGKLESTTARGRPITWGPRETFGVLEAIANRFVAAPVFATRPTRTLQLSAPDLAEILEDNFGLLSAARRGLARRLLATGQPIAGRTPPTLVAPLLGLVDRVIALRQQPPFARGGIQALAALAQASDELRFHPGELVTQAGELADGGLIVIDGMLRATPRHPTTATPRILGPGEAVGQLEALAETFYTTTTEAITPVRILRWPGIALVDVMEDHTDLALAVVAQLASALLDADDRGVARDEQLN